MRLKPALLLLSILLFFTAPLSAGLKQYDLKNVNIPLQDAIKKKISDYTNSWYQLSDEQKKTRNTAGKIANDALSLYKAGKFAESLSKYELAYQTWPDLLETLPGYAATLVEQNDFTKAITSLEKYLDKYDSLDINANRLLGFAYVKNKEPAKALPFYFKAAKLNPKDKTIWIEIANIYYEDASYDYAYGLYQNALKLNATDLRIYQGLGNILLFSKDYEEARKIFERGLKIDSKNINLKDGYDQASAFILIRKADEALKKNKKAEALKLLLQADSIVSGYYPLLVQIGKLYIDDKQFQKAKPYFEEASRIQAQQYVPWYFLGFINQLDGNFTDAMTFYKNAQTVAPNNPQLLTRMGEIQIEWGFPEKALEFLKRSYYITNSSVPNLTALGVANYKMEDYKSSFTYFSNASVLDPKNQVVWNYLNRVRSMILVQEGNSHFEQKEYPAALTSFQQALKFNSSFTDARINLANTYIELGQIKSGLPILTSLYKANTNSLVLIESLAAAYERNNQPELAKPFHEKIERLKGSDPMAYYRIGLSFEINNRLDDAISSYQEVLKLDKGFIKAEKRLATVYYKQGIDAYNIGNMDLALDLLGKSLEHDPTNIDIVARIAYIKAFRVIKEAISHFKAENYGKALESYLAAEKISDKIPELYYGLGQTYYELEEPSKAVDSLLKAIDLNPEMLDAYKLAAEIERRRANYTEASKYLNLAIAFYPVDPELYNSLGYVFFQNNDLENATAMYKKAITLDPLKSDFHVNLGLVYFKEGHYELSETSFRAADTLKPGQDDVYYNIGLTLYKQNRFQESEQAFITSITIKSDIPDKFFSLARTLYYIDGRINDSIQNAEKALSMRDAPHYYYGLGKILEKKMETARQVDIEKFREAAINAYKTVVSRLPDTQLAFWSEERLKILLQEVRLVKFYESPEPLNSSVLVSGSDVFVAGIYGGLFDFNPDIEDESGMKWEFRSDAPINHPIIMQNESLFVADDSTLYRLDKTSGELSGSFRPDAEISSPLYLSPDNTIYFGTEKGKILGVKDNSLVFEALIGTTINSKPVISGKNIIVSTIDGTVYAVDMQDSSIKWRFLAPGPIKADILLWNNNVIVGDQEGNIIALDNASGKIKWKIRTDAPVIKAGIVSKNTLYYPSGNTLNAIAENGQYLWKHMFIEKISTLTPPNSKNMLFLGGDAGALYGYNLDEKRLLWTYRIDAPASGDSVLIADNMGLFPSVNGRIYQLEFLQ